MIRVKWLIICRVRRQSLLTVYCCGNIGTKWQIYCCV